MSYAKKEEPIDPMTGLTYSEVERRMRERRDRNLRQALGMNPAPLAAPPTKTGPRNLVCFRATDAYGQAIALAWGPRSAWQGGQLPITNTSYYGYPRELDDSFLVVGEFPQGTYYTLTAKECDTVSVLRTAGGISYLPMIGDVSLLGMFVPN